MVGRLYLERGEPVVVLARWGPGGGPRNVLLLRPDGSRFVRSFRGLRRLNLRAYYDGGLCWSIDSPQPDTGTFLVAPS